MSIRKIEERQQQKLLLNNSESNNTQKQNLYLIKQLQPKLINYNVKHKVFRTRSKNQLLKNPCFNNKNKDNKNETLSEHNKTNNQQSDKSLGKNSANSFIMIQQRFKTIQTFLQSQNRNLKQQNKMLMEQIKKISMREAKYKKLYYDCKEQIQLLKQLRDVYINQVQQLKMISISEIKKLQQKLCQATIQNYDQLQQYEIKEDEVQVNNKYQNDLNIDYIPQ